jgi:hypothetical protein
MKRNESLRSIGVVLAGSIYQTDRYRREPDELYGADAYVEDPDLPGALIPLLEKLGIPVASTAASAPEPALPASPVSASVAIQEALPRQAPAPSAATPSGLAPATTPDAAAEQGDDGLVEERSKAERLARIIVSDIILYNEEKFAEALQRDSVLEMMSPDLEEGRDLFRNRIDERVRRERDHLVEELMRVARQRGTA